MPVIDLRIAPLPAHCPTAGLIEEIIPDPRGRDAAKLGVLKRQGSQDIETPRAQLSTMVAETQSAAPWSSRAPLFALCNVHDDPFVGLDGPDRSPRAENGDQCRASISIRS